MRVDQYSLAGVWQKSTQTKTLQYTGTWSNSPAVLATWTSSCDRPKGVWADGTNLYGTTTDQCGSGEGNAVWKMDLATGTMIGWHGSIRPGYSPIGGEANCAGAVNVTPGWCQGGGTTFGYKLGQFGRNSTSANFVSGDSYFIYISDEDTQRITRIPK